MKKALFVPKLSKEQKAACEEINKRRVAEEYGNNMNPERMARMAAQAAPAAAAAGPAIEHARAFVREPEGNRSIRQFEEIARAKFGHLIHVKADSRGTGRIVTLINSKRSRKIHAHVYITNYDQGVHDQGEWLSFHITQEEDRSKRLNKQYSNLFVIKQNVVEKNLSDQDMERFILNIIDKLKNIDYELIPHQKSSPQNNEFLKLHGKKSRSKRPKYSRSRKSKVFRCKNVKVNGHLVSRNRKTGRFCKKQKSKSGSRK